MTAVTSPSCTSLHLSPQNTPAVSLLGRSKTLDVLMPVKILSATVRPNILFLFGPSQQRCRVFLSDSAEGRKAGRLGLLGPLFAIPSSSSLSSGHSGCLGIVRPRDLASCLGLIALLWYALVISLNLCRLGIWGSVGVL